MQGILVFLVVAVVGEIGYLEALLLEMRYDSFVEVFRVTSDDQSGLDVLPFELDCSAVSSHLSTDLFLETCGLAGAGIEDVDYGLSEEVYSNHVESC